MLSMLFPWTKMWLPRRFHHPGSKSSAPPKISTSTQPRSRSQRSEVHHTIKADQAAWGWLDHQDWNSHLSDPRCLMMFLWVVKLPWPSIQQIKIGTSSICLEIYTVSTIVWPCLEKFEEYWRFWHVLDRDYIFFCVKSSFAWRKKYEKNQII